MTSASVPSEASVYVTGLVKRFGDLLAVDGLSLTIHPGEIFGFLGPNGAGKTTSISMMCGLMKPDAGEAYVFGCPTTGTDPRGRNHVGVCPQAVVVWPRLTCLEQLEFMGEVHGLPLKLARLRSEALLQALGLQDKTHELAKTLSGGMQRRLSIALALVHDPDIVVLDEPEAGLDPQSRVLVREYITSLSRDKHKTVIFTTHNMDEAERIVDRVAIIDHGKLVELDTPERLKKRIGTGDTLEVGLTVSGAPLQEAELHKLRESFPSAEASATGLVLHQRALIDDLASVLDRLRVLGMTITRLQLRENTLEDVFISLTGRSLRE
jgi:ABC-2 type transport system ATP-binding protein